MPPAASGAPLPTGVASAARVRILSYDGVDDLDLFGGYGLLSKAAEIADAAGQPGLDVRIVAAACAVRTAGGVAIRVDGRLSEVDHADAVVVPGGRGALQAAADARLLAVLRACRDRRTAVYGICSGSVLIAAAGLAPSATDRLAIHAHKQELLRRHTAASVCHGLVRSGRLCTVGGDRHPSLKSIDLAFAVLADVAPHLIDPVSERTELVPGRRAAANRSGARTP